MDIIIIDHTEERIYSNMHEMPGAATRLLDALRQINKPWIYSMFSNIDRYIITSFDQIPVRKNNIDCSGWDSMKFDNIYVIEIQHD